MFKNKIYANEFNNAQFHKTKFIKYNLYSHESNNVLCSLFLTGQESKGLKNSVSNVIGYNY